jgi:hypothetical protein
VATYRIGDELKTVDVSGTASIYMDFFDSPRGSIYKVTTEMPSGEYFSGINDSTHNMFQAKGATPGRFRGAEVFINYSSKVLIGRFWSQLFIPKIIL